MRTVGVEGGPCTRCLAAPAAELGGARVLAITAQRLPSLTCCLVRAGFVAAGLRLLQGHLRFIFIVHCRVQQFLETVQRPPPRRQVSEELPLAKVPVLWVRRQKNNSAMRLLYLLGR
eukprot:9067929-Pyramimonas_sp.AAC.1